MKPASIPQPWARPVLAWLTALLLAIAPAPPAVAQPDAPAAPAVPAAEIESPPAPPGIPAAADPEEASDLPPLPTVPRGQRLNEVVMVGGDAAVRTNQVADQVVVIRGSAVIDGDVDGDVVVILGRLTVRGNVRGDVVVVLGDTEIDGTVRGDLTMVLNASSRLGPKANVQGDVVAVGSRPELDPAAKIRGDPQFVSFDPVMRYVGWLRDYLFEGVFLLRPFPPTLGWVWGLVAISLAFHLVLAFLFPQALRGCVTTLVEQPARSFLLGLLACILVGPLSVLLSFTVIATPLLWLAFAALAVFGRMAVYAAAGTGLGRPIGMNPLGHPAPALLLGSVVFYLSYMVPVLGFFVYWIVLPWGVGAVLIRSTEAFRRERRVPPPGGYGAPGTSLPAGYDASAAASSLATGGGVPPATQALGTEAAMGNPLPPPPAPLPPPPPIGYAAAPADLTLAPRAGFLPRFGAALIDVVVIAFVNGFTFGEVKSFWVLLAAYHLILWTWKGSTLGGSILGLRLIRLDGRPVDWATSAVRVLGSIVSLIPFGLGFFWASWDEQAQSWHDRIAGTTIVKADRQAALV